MSYIMVTADFPKVTPEQRQKIYDCLKGKNWVKVEDPGRDISTTWQGSFDDSSLEDNCKTTAINNFVECSKAYCKPKLVIHWGPHQPKTSGF